MCGFSAISLNKKATIDINSTLLTMNQQQSERGPDGDGVNVSGSAGIGMVRLRMRADSSEPEPIPLDQNRFVGYNGEIYWDGQCLPSGGAGEVFSLFEDKDNLVDGMFSAAMLDQKNDTIELRRDVFGIKPLVIRETNNGIFAASHCSALLSLDTVPEVRQEAVAQFLTFGKPLDGQGFIKGIRNIPPGSKVLIKDGQILQTQKRDIKLLYPDLLPTANDIRSAVKMAIQRILPSDRSLGLAVSGGLDSTIIAYELDQLGIEDLSTVSVLVTGSSDGIDTLDQLPLSGNAHKSWQHSSITVTPQEFAKSLLTTPAQLGEPTGMSSVPLYAALAQLAKKSGIVALILGEGADELFMGYSSYQSIEPSNPQAFNNFMMSPDKQVYLKALLGESVVKDMTELLLKTYPAGEYSNVYDRIRAAELEHSLGPLLHRADQLLMAQSIEGRTPFLHAGIADLAFSMPASAHLQGNQGKILLRQAFPEVSKHPGKWNEKKAFRAPFVDWLAGPLNSWAKDQLQESTEILIDMGIRREGIDLLIDDCGKGIGSVAQLVQQLISLASWRKWIDSGGSHAKSSD
jgi:asparagine synthase (glutamine-hydrolysing)